METLKELQDKTGDVINIDYIPGGGIYVTYLSSQSFITCEKGSFALAQGCGKSPLDALFNYAEKLRGKTFCYYENLQVKQIKISPFFSLSGISISKPHFPPVQTAPPPLASIRDIGPARPMGGYARQIIPGKEKRDRRKGFLIVAIATVAFWTIIYLIFR